MKTFSLIFRYVASSLAALVALVFTVLEATLLVTLDFTLYENPLVALLQLVLRLLLASSALTVGILSLVKRTRSFLFPGFCLLASSVVMIPFMSNRFGIYFTVLSVLFLLSQVLFLRLRE